MQSREETKELVAQSTNLLTKAKRAIARNDDEGLSQVLNMLPNNGFILENFVLRLIKVKKETAVKNLLDNGYKIPQHVADAFFFERHLMFAKYASINYIERHGGAGEVSFEIDEHYYTTFKKGDLKNLFEHGSHYLRNEPKLIKFFILNDEACIPIALQHQDRIGINYVLEVLIDSGNMNAVRTALKYLPKNHSIPENLINKLKK